MNWAKVGQYTGVSVSVLPISRPPPHVRISRQPRYRYYYPYKVSISVQVEGLGIGIVRIKFVPKVNHEGGVSVTVLVRIPRPQCIVSRVKKARPFYREIIHLLNVSVELLK